MNNRKRVRDRHCDHNRERDHDEGTDLESNAGDNPQGRIRRHDPGEWILKAAKRDAPTFDGRMVPRVIFDWVSDMDHYF